MEIKLNITDETLKDLLCGAFEGGSNYWIDMVSAPNKEERPANVEYWHECPVHGIPIVVHVQDDKAYTLNRAELEKGLQVMADKAKHHLNDILCENTDATTADVFLQCCLFGEIVYG